MKNNSNLKKNNSKSLRTKLTIAFVIFGASLLAVLWIMQSVFMERYYENSMMRKANVAILEVSNTYQNKEDLSYDEFCTLLSVVGGENDLYFYIEAADGTFSISSTEMLGQGRFFNKRFLNDAREMLLKSEEGSIAYTTKLDNSEDLALVVASIVNSNYRGTIYLYAEAPLTPIGPAIDIIRSQLLIVTAFVLVFGIVIAAIVSKKMASPLQKMSKEAEKLGHGDFDVRFESSGYKEIDELANTLNGAAKDLKASADLNKDLLANVSHDLRTPLTMIKSYAEMIKDISGDDKVKREEHLDVIINETDRMADLVNDIFYISKVQSGIEDFNDEVINLKEVAESVFNTYKINEQDGFTMNFSADGEFLIKADKYKIAQVISNLLSNAVRYSDDEKFVELRINNRIDTNEIVLEVEDKGIGIPEEDLEKIWNRYEKASRTGERSSEGTGLGLSICSEILKREGAKYGVRNAKEKGSIFWFSLPKV